MGAARSRRRVSDQLVNSAQRKPSLSAGVRSTDRDAPAKERIMTDYRTRLPPFTEHRVQRDRGSLHVRDVPGRRPFSRGMDSGTSHIYDDLIPHLASAAAERSRFDFLGFGASDIAGGRALQFEQQLGAWKPSWKPWRRQDHPGRP